MKFFSTALAALAVGSAVAAPVNDARSIPAVSVPCPCDDKLGATLPTISLPAPCTTLSTTGVIQATALPVVNQPGNHESGHIDNDKVVIVIHTAVETVNTVEVKVKAQLDLIAKIIGAGDIDAQALLKVIVDLKVDLKVLQDCVPTLHGLIFDVEGLVAADLQVVLDLVLVVEALLAEVEVCLKGLVVLKAEILAVIGVELQACLGLIVAISGPIVEFALGIVANLHVDVALVGLIGQITDCAGRITNTCGGIKSLLSPVLSLLHL